MSYFETVNGAGRQGYDEGMGAAFTTAASSGMRAVQQDLQRLGFLSAGTSSMGADGRWGPVTSSALSRANAYLGRPGTGYTVTNGGRNITIPDDLIAALHTAVPPETAPRPSGPDPSGAEAVDLLPPSVEEAGSRTQMYLIGGSALAIGTIAAVYFLWPQARSTANRRRRRR